MVFNIDIKADPATVPLATLLTGGTDQDRVCVGSFSSPRLARFRELAPQVLTSASPAEVVRYVFGVGLGSPRFASARCCRS